MGSLLASSWRRRGAAFTACVSTLLAAACTEPVYRDDGGEAGAERVGDASDGSPSCDDPECRATAPMDGGTDAGDDAMPGAGDPIRERWIGRYATRTFLFALDTPLRTTGRFLTLAEIKPSADGGLILEEELCLFDGEWAFLVVGRLRVDFPGTRVSSVLTYDEESFSSALAKARIGYETSAEGCGAQAGTAQAQAHHAWLSDGTCDCTASEVPDSPRDCRLTDADEDKKPGFTFDATIALSRYDYYVVQEERLRLLNAFKHNDRVYADREFADTTHVLGCAIDGAPARVADCPLGKGGQCAATTQKAELVPLTTPLSCRQVIERETALFLSPQPSFPSNCRQ